MTTDFQNNVAALSELVGKLSMELVYAEPGKDLGLLPINFLVSQAEEMCSAAAPPAEFQSALNSMRQAIEAIFETTGLFNEVSIKALGDLATWMETALGAVESGQNLPPLPVLCAAESDGDAGNSPARSPEKEAAPATPAAPAGNDLPLELNLEHDGDLLREFVSESHEHLQNIELGVLVLEDKPDDEETLASIFRAFHTFKGGSGLLNLKPVYQLAHELESLLDLARQHKLAIDATIIDLILEGGDTLKHFTCTIEKQISGEGSLGPITIPYQHLIQRVKTAISPVMGSVGAKPSAAASENPAPHMSVADAPPSVSRPSAVFPGQSASSELASNAPKAESSASSRSDMGSSAMVKVATQKLDSLVDLVGEMVIAQSLVAQDPTIATIQNDRLNRNLAQLGRITDDLQKTAMSMRMVPIRSTFQKMNRLVRDLAAKQGKEVELRLRGEETELDRTIVEQLNDPLVHMIRNSMDHGIEMPEARESNGKPRQGTIELNAYHQGGNIVIEIADNGGGMNKAKILKKAIEKGLVKPEENLSEAEIYQLIFAPGFSTAEVVTEISGRGVGMDVVRRNIEQLRGKIEIQSQLGQGSRIKIFLPLTLAIIDGLMVAVGEHRYILPTLLVRESFRPTKDMISTVHERGEMVNVRGRLLGMIRLHELFDVKPGSTDPTQGIIVVIGAGHENRCLFVDQLIGKQEVVIKNLGETFKKNRALAGAAILGDGRVGLILDVDYLVRCKGSSLRLAA
jgi:two-component system chemotaxis sensor kinase CheA